MGGIVRSRNMTDVIVNHSPTDTTPNGNAPDRESGLADARELMAAVYGPLFGRLINISTRDPNKPKGKGWKDHFHNDIEKALRFAEQKSRQGLDVYMGAHLLETNSRRKDTAAPVRALYAEKDDGEELPPGAPEPSFKIRSSPGKVHLYWQLDEPVTPHYAEVLNERIAPLIGADPSGADISQVLRPPGTQNFKYDPPQPVEMIEKTGKVYTWRELEVLLPPAPSTSKPAPAPQPDPTPRASRDDEPPVRLNEHGEKIWKGELPVRKPDGSVDRSKTLIKIGATIARAGGTFHTISDAVEDRDAALGYFKYPDRPDQYDAIAEKVVAEFDVVLTTDRTFRFQPFDEFRNRPRPAWSIRGVLKEKSLSVIVGDPGSFKTFIALAVAYAIATGRDWFGHATTPGAVAYLAAEGADGLIARGDALARHHGAPVPGNLYLLGEMVNLVTEIDALIAALVEIPDLLLIIIDTLARTFSGNENLQEDMSAYITAADRIRNATGAAVLLIHHNNRSGEYRGSSALHGALDTMISTEKTGTGVVLECAKQKDAEPFDPIRLEKRVIPLSDDLDLIGLETSLIFDLAGSVPGDESPLDQFTVDEGKALIVLRDSIFAAEGFSQNKWAEAAGVSKSGMTKLADKLVKGGYVAYDGGEVSGRAKRFRLTDEGRRVLEPAGNLIHEGPRGAETSAPPSTEAKDGQGEAASQIVSSSETDNSALRRAKSPNRPDRSRASMDASDAPGADHPHRPPPLTGGRLDGSSGRSSEQSVESEAGELDSTSGEHLADLMRRADEGDPLEEAELARLAEVGRCPECGRSPNTDGYPDCGGFHRNAT
jgi:DNA-binding MarR family transcriptional regulator